MCRRTRTRARCTSLPHAFHSLLNANGILPGLLDTADPLEIAFLEPYGREVASGNVPTLGVVKHLEVIEDIGLSVLPGEIDLTANAFAQKGFSSMSGELASLI